MLSYKEAYDKIIQAYFKDEIKPYDAQFCFCGTLANGGGWHSGHGGYSREEYGKMEWALLYSINNYFCDNSLFCFNQEGKINHPLFEEALFEGMSAALDVLKQIHIEHGEIIDEDFKLTQRQISIPQSVN